MAHRLPIPEVFPLERGDEQRAGGVLSRAFFDTEQWVAVVPDDAVRLRKLDQMFTGTVRLTFAAGGVAERTQGFEGVALWLPPGRDVGFWPMVKSGFASARFAITPPFPDMRRLMRMFQQFDQSRKRTMPQPHWYLMALGVDPNSQGMAYGPALVLAGCDKADHDNLPMYIETELGPNVAFYEKLGFVVVDDLVIDAYDLSFALMERQPSESS